MKKNHKKYIKGYRDLRDLKRIRQEKAAYQDNKCFWCGDPFTEESPATADHVIELSRGGEFLNPRNIVAACQFCNGTRSYGTMYFVARLIRVISET